MDGLYPIIRRARRPLVVDAAAPPVVEPVPPVPLLVLPVVAEPLQQPSPSKKRIRASAIRHPSTPGQPS